MRARLLVLLALLALPTTTVKAQTGFPLTVTDDSGVQSTFAAPPRRIVSLNPGHTETVFALGAGDRLVAVDSFANYPAEAELIQPRLETFPTVSVETVVSLKPDLVLSLVERDDVLNQIRQQGIPVMKLLPRDFDATTREIAMLGQVLGAPERGAALATEMQTRKQRIIELGADAPRPDEAVRGGAERLLRPDCRYRRRQQHLRRPAGRLRPGQRGECDQP